MIKCPWMCSIQGFLTPMSGLMSASCSMENLYRQREKEIKDRMSFTAISLIDYIDMFNPPLLSHFHPLPFFLIPICSSVSLSLTLLSWNGLPLLFLFVSSSYFSFRLFKYFFSILPFIYSSCSICLSGRPSQRKRVNIEPTSALLVLIETEHVSKWHHAELEMLK